MPKSSYKQSRTNFANRHLLNQSWHRARGGINTKIVFFSLLGPRLAQGRPEETPKRNKVSEIWKSDVAKLTQGSKMTPKTITLTRSAFRSELLSLHRPRHLLLLALLPACAGLHTSQTQRTRSYLNLSWNHSPPPEKIWITRPSAVAGLGEALWDMYDIG